MKNRLNKIGYLIISRLGQKIIDNKTGEKLGRALVFYWGGQLHIIGYTGKPLVVRWAKSDKLRYWHSSLIFRAQEEADFERTK
ncbi:MAG: hypothetical protein ACSHX6_03670 [Akkermansiaceae bacterium]